jgi:hypothetical protein
MREKPAKWALFPASDVSGEVVWSSFVDVIRMNPVAGAPNEQITKENAAQRLTTLVQRGEDCSNLKWIGLRAVHDQLRIDREELTGSSVKSLRLWPNLVVDHGLILQKPALLLFLRLKETDQRVLHAAGPCSLNLPLYSGFQDRIVNLNFHVPLAVFYEP